MANIYFFIDREGQTRGPCPFEQLQQFAQDGTLHANDLVWPEGSDQKQIAKNVAGLIFSSASGTQAPSPPPIKQPITYQSKTAWSSFEESVSSKPSNINNTVDSAWLGDFGDDPREKRAKLALLEDQLQMRKRQGSPQSDRSYIVAILLCLFLGPSGIHRFYLGYTFVGIIQFLTAGCCYISCTIDLFLIIFRVLNDKDGGRLR
jgi:hypothetical protein